MERIEEARSVSIVQFNEIIKEMTRDARKSY